MKTDATPAFRVDVDQLHWATDEAPGFRRRSRGRGFSYTDERGRPPGEQHLRRIQALAVPPAWTDVWIALDPAGHLQATGRDAAGRKQYVYHPAWRAAQEANKFSRLAAFGRALPRIRAAVDRDLRSAKLSRARVTAAAVHLLDLASIRVGNDQYARTNGTFGLTTLRSRHVDVNGSCVHVSFKGKGGKEQTVDVRDRRLARVVQACDELPGQALFQFSGEDGTGRIRSEDINGYIREAAGGDFSAKDFRTWSASVMAAAFLAESLPPQSEAELKRQRNDTARYVAAFLGNTPAICKRCYIHPAVFEAFADGSLGKAWRAHAGRWTAGRRDPHEALLLHLLRNPRSSGR